MWVSDGDAPKCSKAINPSDNSTLFPNTNPYGGIPTNLFINLIGFILLLLMFLFMRRSAWKAINKIVRKDDMERLTHMFFSFTTGVLSHNKRVIEDDEPIPPEDNGTTSTAIEEDDNRCSILHEEHSTQIKHLSYTEAVSNESTSNHDEDESEKDCSANITNIINDKVLETDHDSIDVVVEDKSNALCHRAEDIGGEDEIRVLGPQPKQKITLVENENVTLRRQRFPRQVSMISDNSEHSKSFGAWLKSIFTMSDEDILGRCGNDALQYLRFQRHVIFYLTVPMVLSISIILPLNFQGHLAGNATDFEHTTLGNLDPSVDPDRQYLWAHISLSFLLFPLSILVMRRFSVDLRFTQMSLEMSRTLLIEKIPKNLCRSTEELKRYIEEAFPTCEVVTIKFAYNVSKLEVVNQKLNEVKSALSYCIRKGKLDGEVPKYPPIDVYPKQCSRYCACFCFCCVSKLDGMEFYGEEKQKLLEKFEEEKNEALKTPLGIAFITFKSYQMAKDVHDSFRTSMFTCWKARPPKSSLSSILKPQNWNVSYAPVPDDIYWENLGSSRFWWIKYLAANTVLFIFLLFLSTPAELLSQMNEISHILNIPSIDEAGGALELPAVIANFLPTLMILGFTAVLPVLVSWSDRFLGHWTRSAENHAIMKKTFWYLVFMVIMLPTFGFTSAFAVLKTVLSDNSTEHIEWECIFLPDSGAFFVNYLITAAMVGCGMELLRLPELLWYTIQLCWSRSKAETPYIRSTLAVYEFRFGEQYARMMMLFCMSMLYSITCPLITPFGLLYFVIKHYVDRHNLLYAYKPSKINKKVHSTAINFVILTTVILQFFMMMFSLIRSGSWNDMTTISEVSIFFFLLSANIYCAQLWADTCKKFSPIDYIENTIISEELSEQEKNSIYSPFTLMDDDEKGKYLAFKKRRARSALVKNEYGTF